MHIVHVHIHVKPERVQAFKQASIENASNSINEPGIARFDVVEVYRAPDDQLKHRETTHYQKWRDAVADMMAEPRFAVKLTNLFPADQGWG